MDVAYAAHTDSCIFMLDDAGICRWVTTRGGRVSAKTAANAQRCIGAQYLASVDPTAEGGLAALPKVGAAMLFAFVGEDGRIALVRTDKVVRFEDRRAEASGAYLRDESGSIDVDVDELDALDADERTRRFRAGLLRGRPDRVMTPAPQGRRGAATYDQDPPTPRSLPQRGALPARSAPPSPARSASRNTPVPRSPAAGRPVPAPAARPNPKSAPARSLPPPSPPPSPAYGRLRTPASFPLGVPTQVHIHTPPARKRNWLEALGDDGTDPLEGADGRRGDVRPTLPSPGQSSAPPTRAGHGLLPAPPARGRNPRAPQSSRCDTMQYSPEQAKDLRKASRSR